MFKYGNEQVLLGMRFYKFIDEDEFEIYSIVRFEDDKKATFMNEETFELVTITSCGLYPLNFGTTTST